MQGHQYLGLLLSVAVVAGCHTEASRPDAPAPVASNEPTEQGTAVGDEKTAMEAAVEGAPSRVESSEEPRKGIPLADNAPDSYVVKRGDTLWGISKVFFA